MERWEWRMKRREHQMERKRLVKRLTNKERGRTGRGQTEKDIEDGEGMSM